MASFWCGILTLCIQTPEGELKPEVNDICCSVVPLCAPVGARPERLMMRPHATRTTTTQDPGIPVPTKIAISITPRGAAKLEQLHKACGPLGIAGRTASQSSALMPDSVSSWSSLAWRSSKWHRSSAVALQCSMTMFKLQRSAATRLFPCAAMPCVGPRAQDFDLGGGFYYSGSYPRWCFNTVQKWAGRLNR